MTSTVEITSPELDQESTNILQYDTISSRYFLSRCLNRNLKALGDDIILDGFEVIDSKIGDIVYFEISSGKAICDLSLIDSNDSVELTFQSNLFESTGEIIIVLNYKYNELDYNTAKLKIYFLNSLDNIFPDTFDLDYDRIIIAHYTLNDGVLLKTNMTFNSEIYKVIQNKIFEIYPISNLLKTELNYIEKIETLYNY